MTVASESTGTQTATVTTEHTLVSPSSAKTRVLLVDLSNMVAGDILELRINAKIVTGGTARLAYIATFSGVAGEPAVPSVPVPMPWGGSFTLKQTAGTSRNYDWSVLTLD